MRINKTMKEEIVRKVMEIKFPQTKEDELKRDVGEFIRSNMSFPSIPKELEKYVNFSSTIRLMTVYGNGLYDSDFIEFNVKTYPATSYYEKLTRYIDVAKNKRDNKSGKAPNGTKKLYDKWRKHLKKRDEFREMLEGSLLSINTEKQLKDNLPELEKFLPKKNCGLVPVESFKEVRKELKGL